MARYTGPVCRLCRREGVKLYLKGDRCYTDKCGVTRRTYAPGQHGQGRKKVSEYGIQLREKQKLRRIYGMMESQFARYFDIADRKKGITGENLLTLLEQRLDNVVYRLGFAVSRAQARQLVRHGHFSVDGKKVSIPSYIVGAGSIIMVRDKSREMPLFKELAAAGGVHATPAWMEVDLTNLTGKVVSLPTRDQIDIEVQEHMIVELYSR